MISKETIEEVKNRLIKAYNPIAIYLFGSYAWGSPDEESDLDLLVVIEHSDQKPYRRVDVATDVLWDLNISKDLMIYTQDEFNARVNDRTSLIYKVKNHGRVLYARS